MKKVLTIAGSDPSGGAGIQADLKTIAAHGLYGMSAVTALTAQNTTGVSGIFPVPAAFVKQQMDSVFTDIFPDAVKIGMVSEEDVIQGISEKLKEYQAKHIVVDPVMVSTSGCRLIPEEAVECLVETLFPLAEVITPNLMEAQVLLARELTTVEDMKQAAQELSERYHTGVLIKGGHLKERAADVLFSNGTLTVMAAEFIANPNTHGTGCTLSSAIACGLAAGNTLPESVRCAKEYVRGAIAAGLDLGAGSGPLHHMYQYFIT